jgi:hypothetical protein
MDRASWLPLILENRYGGSGLYIRLPLLISHNYGQFWREAALMPGSGKMLAYSYYPTKKKAISDT